MARAIAIRPAILMTMMMTMAEIANHAKEPWPPLDWASWIFDRASWVLVGSLILGAGATVAIVWMGFVKEHHWDLAREVANRKIGELNLQAERLKASNLVLQQQLVATHHALADRFIWYDQRAAFQEALSKYPGMTVRIWMYPASSPDTFTLGMTIIGLMMGAKWQATLWDLHTASPVPGVHVLYRKGVPDSKEAADALVAGLLDSRIELVGGPTAMEANEPAAIPPAPATVAFATTKDIPAEEAIRVFIGGKANPFR